MKPFRKNVAIAIDGGGIRGVLVARALMVLEEALGKPLSQVCGLAAGTSTGSILSAGIASGLSAADLHKLYVSLGETIFRKSWRTFFFPLTPYRYPHEPLAAALQGVLGQRVMSDFWTPEAHFDVVITAFDLESNHTRFVKPWKDEYKDWSVVKAVLASSSVPTYFPAVDGRYVDGGVGSYCNPCYLAAYEAQYCLEWDASETTLISVGTGRYPHSFDTQKTNQMWVWKWLSPLLDAFSQSADDQQVHLVCTFFDQLDFRRFQIDLPDSIAMDSADQIQQLSELGEALGKKIINDEIDPVVPVCAIKA